MALRVTRFRNSFSLKFAQAFGISGITKKRTSELESQTRNSSILAV